MTQNTQLNIQCFVKKEYQPQFVGDNAPRLLYVSDIQPAASRHPRIMHAHADHAEIVLIRSGSSEYLIDDKKQTIRQGDLLIYNAGVVHDEISGSDTPVGSYCIAVGGLHMPGLRKNALIPDSKGYIFPTGEHFAELEMLCGMMFQNLSHGGQHAEAFCHTLMQAFLIKVLDIVGGTTTENDTVEEPHVLGRQIKAYIDAHYMEPITLQSIADSMHISLYYMSHVFKQMSGYSPMQYLLRRRIGEAQTLLLTTEYPIVDIAGMVGYDTQSYFNAQFTKHVGMSPMKYRQSYIVNAEDTKSKQTKKRKG